MGRAGTSAEIEKAAVIGQSLSKVTAVLMSLNEAERARGPSDRSWCLAKGGTARIGAPQEVAVYGLGSRAYEKNRHAPA